MGRNLERMTLSQARRILARSRDLPTAYGRGYFWLNERFLPALKRVEQSARRKADRMIAAQGYYILGDIHDFNHAPRAAIRAYRRCLRLDPEASGAHREIGNMLDRMGMADPALAALKRAVRMDPDDEHARGDLEWLEEELAEDGYLIPLYEEGDPVWESGELLAQNKVNAALRRLDGVDSIDVAIARGACYGALRDLNGVVDQWNAIASSEGEINARGRFWFHMPRSIINSPRLWEAIARVDVQRLEDLGWGFMTIHSEALPPDRYPDRTGRRRKGDALTIEYELARTRKDHASARRILDRFPDWSLAKQLVAKLEARPARSVRTT